MNTYRFEIGLNIIIITALVLIFLIIAFKSPCECVLGTSYSNYNVITYKDFDALTEEYVDVWISHNKDRQEDVFLEHDLKRFCQ